MTSVIINHLLMPYIAVFILGAVSGSFTGLVISRLPQIMAQVHLPENPNSMHTILRGLSIPGSYCPQCKYRLKIIDLVPLLSYIVLNGKCRNCAQKIPPFYFIIELLSGLLAIWSFIVTGNLTAAFLLFICCSMLLVISVIDLKLKIVYDELSLPLLWLGLIVNLNHYFVSIDEAIIGAVGGYLLLWAVFQIHFLIRRQPGLGYGDFKVLAAIGAWFGWQSLPIVLFGASLSGLLYFAILWFQGKVNTKSPMAFAPFLALGAFIYLNLVFLLKWDFF